jgi:hypothetical protein
LTLASKGCPRSALTNHLKRSSSDMVIEDKK